MSLMILLTGPPGSGKTSVIDSLRRHGVTCVDEPARRVIAQQRAMGGKGTSDQDPALFIELMLETAIRDYEDHRNQAGPVVFDRGIPDLIGYAEHFGLQDSYIREAAASLRYNQTALLAPPWEAIYTTDAERTLTFDGAVDFGKAIEQAYEQARYELQTLPFEPVEARAAFVLDEIGNL